MVDLRKLLPALLVFTTGCPATFHGNQYRCVDQRIEDGKYVIGDLAGNYGGYYILLDVQNRRGLARIKDVRSGWSANDVLTYRSSGYGDCDDEFAGSRLSFIYTGKRKWRISVENPETAAHYEAKYKFPKAHALAFVSGFDNSTVLKVVYHQGESVSLRTRGRKGLLSFTPESIAIGGEDAIEIPYKSIDSVDWTTMPGGGHMVKLIYNHTPIFISVVRINILGYFVIVNFYKTVELHNFLMEMHSKYAQ